MGKIVPIIKKGETLAYYVEFSNNLGWNLIAADTRVTPVLSESPTGYLVFQDEGPVNGILGTLKNVIDIVDNTYFLMNWVMMAIVMMLLIWLEPSNIIIMRIFLVYIMSPRAIQV